MIKFSYVILLLSFIHGKALKAYFYPLNHRLTYLVHIYELLIIFVLTSDQGLNSSIFSRVHNFALSVVTFGKFIKGR